MGTKDPVLAPYQTFPTADGHINVACLNDRLFERLCEAIDRPDLAEDDRFETNADRVDNMPALEAELTATLERRSTDEWMARLVEEAGVPAGPVLDVEDALYNEQTEARGAVRAMDDGDRSIPVVEHPLHFGESESGFDSPPPGLGEHTREVFRELGYDEETLDDMAEAGAFGDD